MEDFLFVLERDFLFVLERVELTSTWNKDFKHLLEICFQGKMDFLVGLMANYMSKIIGCSDDWNRRNLLTSRNGKLNKWLA